MKKNLLYVQSGGVTSVINASACGLFEAARAKAYDIDKTYAAAYGIGGLLAEEINDLTKESTTNIAAFRYTPGGIFGSCRHRMKNIKRDPSEYQRIYEIFKAHNIGYFFYNGGGGSMDAINKIANFCYAKNLEVKCIGIPKTIDNDLDGMDNCPGYGSVAKFTATAVLESGLDVASMHTTSTKVLIMEVMGRNAGWIAAAAGLAHTDEQSPPHIIIFPEVPLERQEFLRKVDACVKKHGYCVVVVAEGAVDNRGNLLGVIGSGAQQRLGGAANTLALLINQLLGYKYHCVICDYLQRSARHLSSRVDVEQAYAVGKAAFDLAMAGETRVVPTIERLASMPYRWRIGKLPLAKMANSERLLPLDYIGADQVSITAAAREHIAPLIQGEDSPPYANGLPLFATKNFARVPKQLQPWPAAAD